eukprot:CAMPEP_0179471170 /NCGR_PEP_ID=MMETSP0799-20121207/51466_1 /TAXON_ID=46947 /ORGANISM="Geminigera cryophila, Strain CCMP2564" /LENGTH=99 /DNA_ID=CAMNT_0021278645 /DNA_START=218 /DNA_END=517 /DNA_ORIENTATION=+
MTARALHLAAFEAVFAEFGGRLLVVGDVPAALPDNVPEEAPPVERESANLLHSSLAALRAASSGAPNSDPDHNSVKVLPRLYTSDLTLVSPHSSISGDS